MMTIDDVRKDEVSKMTWWDNTTNNYPKVVSTQSLVSTIVVAGLGDETIVRPSIILKIVSVIFLALLLYVGLIVLLITNADTLPLVLGVFIFLLSMASFLIYKAFYDKNYNYKIRIYRNQV